MLTPESAAPGGRFAWFYLGLLAAAEWVTAERGSAPGLGCYALLLPLLLLHAYVAEGRAENRAGDLYVVLALLPLLRIVSLTLPLPLAAPTDQLGLVNLLFLGSLLLTVRALRYAPGEALGLNLRHLALQLPIALSGLLSGALVYALLPQPALAGGVSLAFARPVASLFAAGLVEELFFRGLLLGALTRALGATQGLLFSALLYASFHLSWASWGLVGLMLAQGLVFGWLALRTRSVVGVALAHGLANLLLFVVLPNGFLS